MIQQHLPIIRRTHYGILGVVLIVITLLGGQPQRVHAEQFRIILSASSVAAGSTIEFTGSGFVPGERVALWYTSPSQSVLGGDYADTLEDGRFTSSFKVPAEAIGGVWAVTAYGETSRVAVIANFTVIGQAPAAAELLAAVQPSSAPAGSTFAFAATGFQHRELVSYWLTGPDGVVKAAYDREARTNDDGRVDLTWTAPTNAMPGTWVLTVQGIKSNVARGIPFTVR